jgi:tungstate transport system substrate-binding protein
MNRPENAFAARCLAVLLLGCAASWAGAVVAGDVITLSSTTSTQNSGFFEWLLPKFTAQTGIDVRVIAVGTGQALKLGEQGDADVLLVHDRDGELQFIAEGHGIDRREVMYNDFVVVGPRSDPARIGGGRDAAAAFRAIASSGRPFVSRGDDSGTHRQESRLWEAAGIDVRAHSGKWYKEVGAGMGAVLNTAAGLDGYTMSDRATWATFRNRADLTLLVERDPVLFNQYAVILVNPARHPHVKADSARRFSDWLVSAQGQALIGAFRIDGQTLFYPNAAPAGGAGPP